MDDAIARRLNDLNARFYEEQASSFSATRQAPWPGWRRCLALAREAWGRQRAENRGTTTGQPRAGGLAPRRGGDAAPTDAPALAVLDLACGNLRFERFLADELPGCAMDVDAVDRCEPLAAGAAAELPAVRFYRLDVVGALLDGGAMGAGRGAVGGAARAAADATTIEGAGAAGAKPTQVARSTADAARPLLASLGLAPRDLAVSFGFLHHVPGFENRAALLRALVGQLRPGGVAAVSLWRFLDDERLARKAQTSHPAALDALGLDPTALDEGDRLLGWQDAPGAWRYCHHFTENEVDALAAAAREAGARELARFDADGASGRLNRYLVLQASA